MHAAPWKRNIRETFKAEHTRRFLMVIIDKIGRFMLRRDAGRPPRGVEVPEVDYIALHVISRDERPNTKFTVNSRNGP